MKQTITIEQWDELTHEQKNKLDDFGALHKWNLGIGELIWFLGGDLYRITNYNTEWSVSTIDDQIGSGFMQDELIDVLWEKVKHKIFLESKI